MNKKIIIPALIVIALLLAGIGYLYVNLDKQKKENEEMQQLAELDKKEMDQRCARNHATEEGTGHVPCRHSQLCAGD